MQKRKGHAPPGEFFALGQKAKASADAETRSTVASAAAAERKTLPSASAALKRDAPSGAAAPLAAKKPRLGSSLFAPLGRPSETEYRSSPVTTQQSQTLYEELAAEVDPLEFMREMEEALDRVDDDRVEALLCGAVKHLKLNRSKPDPVIVHSLMCLAKERPICFHRDLVADAFCGLLRRDAAINFKAKGNHLVSALACNIMLAAFIDEENWNESFVKVYVDDSLGERIWVDRADCKIFVNNVMTAFNTKLPRFSVLLNDGQARNDASGGGSPLHINSYAEDEDTAPYSERLKALTSAGSVEDEASMVFPRYTTQISSVESHILDTMREQLSRRQPMDGGSRHLVRTLTVLCGYPEIRSMVSPRLELWLQNPKLTRAAQDLLMSVCMNADQQRYFQDIEVTNQLIKMRLKTKALINHYLLCIRELIGQSVDGVKRLLHHTVYNELSPARNSNNMSLIAVMFSQVQDVAAKLLSEIFLELLVTREDNVRALRALLREIVRVTKQDFNFSEFTQGLMRERNDSKFKELDTLIKERYCLSVIDIVSVTMLVSVTPQVREAAAALQHGDMKEIETLRSFQKQISVIQRDSVIWLHAVVPKMGAMKATDFYSSLRKLLFQEKYEAYFKVDNWPPENERNVVFRLVSEVPLLEDTLFRVIMMGLSKDFHISASDSIDTADAIIRRAAALQHSKDFQVLKIDRVDLIDLWFSLCHYHHPENILLPKGYQPPQLAISALYWKSWVLLLIVTAFNPNSFGRKAWDNYPTLKYLMEMTMTNTYKYPPPTVAPDEKQAEEIRARDRQLTEVVKHQILEFEGHLAAVTSKLQITESTSLLVSQLTRMDPTGLPVKPPQYVLDIVRALNQTIHIGHLLCSSRDPDYLVDIISRQDASQAMPWLAELVESNDSSLDVLPVQCLCEFVLHDTALPAQDSPSDSDADDNQSDKQKKKSNLKQAQLLSRLQTLVHNRGADVSMVNEVLTYFLQRLSSPVSSTRKQSVKGLSLVLAKTHIEEEEEGQVAPLSPEEIDISPHSAIFRANQKLLDQLSTIPLFDLVKLSTCAALRKACQIETDALWVSAYIVFLDKHTAGLDLNSLDGVVSDMAQMIVERSTLLNHLLPSEESLNPGANEVLTAMNSLFFNYLIKAQQTQNEAYSWSNTQDQIRVQWSTGKTATMNILVVHAMIILLTYGSPKGLSKFSDLLDGWFPQSSPPPSAYLVDTSEEALLLPDWLKLRMIRSSLPRLVDAALADLDPSQLLLFVQSFGIPVDSMSKLLHCLDLAVDTDRESMKQAVSDDTYMTQLVEVQRMRGAKGGDRFHTLLCGPSDPPPTDDKRLFSITKRDRSVSRLLLAAEISPAQCTKEYMSQLLHEIFSAASNESAMEKQKKFRMLTKSLNDDSVACVTLEALEQYLMSPSVRQFVADFENQQSLSCPIFRILSSKKIDRSRMIGCAERMKNIIANKSSNLYRIVAQFLESTGNTKSVGSSSATVSKQSGERLSEPQLLKALESVKKGSVSDLEVLIGSCIEDSVELSANEKSRLTSAICEAIAHLSRQDSGRRSVGLLVDWLEQLHPDIRSTTDPDALLDLLFVKQSATSDSIGSSQPYLVTLLLHRGGWDNVRSVVCRLLSDVTLTQRYDATAVLDFLTACIDMPRLWQGRDKKLPKNYVMEDVLELSALHMPALIGYIVAESLSHPGCDDSENISLRLIGQRKKLYVVSCYNKPDCAQMVVDYLLNKLKVDSPAGGLYRHMLLDMYMSVPGGIGQAEDEIVSDIQSASALHESQLDVVSHHLVTCLGCAAAGDEVENRMKDANIACRKMAAERPALLLRQLPMLAALLQGRAQFTFNEIKSRNYLLLYTHVLGLLELLQPHAFLPEHSQSFLDVLRSYFEFMSAHAARNKNTLGGLIVKFVQLLNSFFNYDRVHCTVSLRQYIPILNEVSRRYPDVPALGSLLAGLSLPINESNTSEVGKDGEAAGPAAGEDVDAELAGLEKHQKSTGGRGGRGGRPTSPWTVGLLMPLMKRLRDSRSLSEAALALKDIDEVSKRRVDILSHFVDDVKKLMLSGNSECRSISHTLSMRLVRHNPTYASQFKEVVLRCLESENVEVVKAMLNNLAEYVLLAREFGAELLEKAFVVGIVGEVETTRHISETLQMLNMNVL